MGASALGVSKDAVHRVWQEADLKPQRLERYLASDESRVRSQSRRHPRPLSTPAAACRRVLASIKRPPFSVVDLSWMASTSGDIVGYNVYRGPDGVTWKKINVSLIASTLYSNSTVANSTTYYYAATAVDIYGHESSKTAAVKTVIP